MNTIREVRDLISNGDSAFCGDCPEWIRQSLVQRLDELLQSGEADKTGLDRFRIGAIRFLADNTGSECELLMANISSLRLS